MKRLGQIFLFLSFCSLLYLRSAGFTPGVRLVKPKEHSGSVLSPAFASTEFETTYDVRYQVSLTGITHVSQNVSLTNKLSNVYATRYALTLQAGQVENITATDSQGPLKIETQKDEEQTKIELTFNERVVGKGKTLTFTLSYDALDLANKNGQIWEIAVPKLADSSQIDHYSLTLAVPQSFGQPAYISPNPVDRDQEENLFIYRFNKNQLSSWGVSAAFGDFQIFDFVISYHLKNPHLTAATTEIALPPDTAYQRIFYQRIDPPPLDVDIDPDGNWLATYQLEGGEKLNIIATGKAKIFAQPQEGFLTPSGETLAKNLAPLTYWPVDDPLIQTTSQKIKTPREIYDFVVKTLGYDFSRVEEGVERLGALKALENPDKAICMEFTDLFIALSRAAGIPAREINGYAHTTNPKLRPLSLVADILHSWPEYWDQEKQIWVPVDPTWGKTTGGLDYFSRVDLNHFVFAIHGQDSQKPYPAGSYKTEETVTKDVQVVFGQYEAETSPQIEAKFELAKELYFEIGGKGKIIIKNKGPSSVYNLHLKIEAQRLSLKTPTEIEIAALPAFGQEEIPLQLSSPLLKFGQANLTVYLNGQQFSQQVKLKSIVLERILPLGLFLLLLTFVIFRVKNRLKLRP